jgi:hypothetical protein
MADRSDDFWPKPCGPVSTATASKSEKSPKCQPLIPSKGTLPELPDQLQPLEIFTRPMRLELNHRPQCLDFECLARPVE